MNSCDFPSACEMNMKDIWGSLSPPRVVASETLVSHPAFPRNFPLRHVIVQSVPQVAAGRCGLPVSTLSFSRGCGPFLSLLLGLVFFFFFLFFLLFNNLSECLLPASSWSFSSHKSPVKSVHSTIEGTARSRRSCPVRDVAGHTGEKPGLSSQTLGV